jgi:urease accessory protein
MSLATLNLLRLASPALPIGAFSYSQGLESAIEQGWVVDAASARTWLADQLQGPIARWEAPLFWRALQAAATGDEATLCALDARWLASRETRELQAETLQTGYSLRQLLLGLDTTQAPPCPALRTLPCLWAVAAQRWGVEPEAALLAWGWSTLENQIMVLMKALPLGQTAGQRLLDELLPVLDTVLHSARSLPDEDLCGFAPGLAWLSATHETQYSRLFRS